MADNSRNEVTLSSERPTENYRYHATFFLGKRNQSVHKRNLNEVKANKTYDNNATHERCDENAIPYTIPKTLEDMRQNLKQYGFTVVDGNNYEILRENFEEVDASPPWMTYFSEILDVWRNRDTEQTLVNFLPGAGENKETQNKILEEFKTNFENYETFYQSFLNNNERSPEFVLTDSDLRFILKLMEERSNESDGESDSEVDSTENRFDGFSGESDSMIIDDFSNTSESEESDSKKSDGESDSEVDSTENRSESEESDSNMNVDVQDNTNELLKQLKDMYLENPTEDNFQAYCEQVGKVETK